MAKQVQMRRGTTSATNAFTGASGEVTVDTDKNRVVVHDASTAGGTPMQAIPGYTTTATAAGTTTLTVASKRNQFFTGTSTQTVVLPVVSTLDLGHTFRIVNRSTGNVTVQSSGANSIIVLGPGSEVELVCILITGTSAASWQALTRYAGLPQKSYSAARTLDITDANCQIYHPSSDNNARTFTIDSNANLALDIGTFFTFINRSATALSIAITTDTMTLAGGTTTGTRTLAQNGMATAVKDSATGWIISGTGLT